MTMRHDILSDVFCVIKNTEEIGRQECTVPASTLVKSVLQIMKNNKYIGDFKHEEDKRGGRFRVTLLGRINDANAIRPRLSASNRELVRYEKRLLPASGVGILIMSTSQGVMDQKTAMKQNTGGKLLGFVY